MITCRLDFVKYLQVGVGTALHTCLLGLDTQGTGKACQYRSIKQNAIDILSRDAHNFNLFMPPQIRQCSSCSTP